METIRREIPNGIVEGSCDARFLPVVEEFERNFRERGEVGASLCVDHEGRTVVDVWGGLARPAESVPWTRDTVSIVFSCTKGATAICAHVLASRGLLDLDAPVAEYWPEFARNGKEGATVRMMLDHSVGLPVCRTQVRAGGCYDWDYMTELLANEEPFWKPGIRNGYHMVNFGWTVGELVRRASGRSLGTFFREEIAQPLGIDFWIGLPEEHEQRVAPMIAYLPEPGEPLAAFVQALLGDPQSIQALSLLNTGSYDPNCREAHAAEIGGAGGISNGRGLAGMYAPLANGGARDGVRLVDRRQLTRMMQVAMATHEDATLLLPTRFGLGFMKSMDNRRRPYGDRDSVILSAPAFGHVGAGGSIGFADPEEGLAFGYSMNRMGNGLMLNERGQSLVDATYRVLGHVSNASGVWSRWA
ncbi:MAG: serine hydrolase domain-containing protein [Thermodesulfobacteriota bacterium]